MGQIAKEFLDASQGGVEQLRAFVNTALGETWHERGDAPDWQRLYERRERYPIATVPAGVLIITAGVDVQRDRLVFEVVGWGDDRQSWSIDAGVLPGDTAGEEVWGRLDELLARSWPGADGAAHSIQMLAVDAGDQTQTVYSWARRYPMSRVIACKGVGTATTIIGAPSTVDVTVRGKRLARGYKVWPIGVPSRRASSTAGCASTRQRVESGLPHPPGYCHFPEHGEEYFRQLTAEHLVTVTKRTGFTSFEWQILPGRENHWLDCRIYARAAAALVGLDRHAAAVVRARPPPAPECRWRAAGLTAAAGAPAGAEARAAPGELASRVERCEGRGLDHAEEVAPMATWTQADVDALKTAVGSGVLTVTYDGPPRRSITYQSLDAMRALLSSMQADVAATAGDVSYRLMTTRKGV